MDGVLPAYAPSLTRRNEGTLLLLLLSSILLGVVIPALFLVGAEGRMSLSVALTICIALWATWRLISTAAKGKRRLSIMCFYVFVYVFFGVQPMRSAWTGVFPLEPFLTSEQTLSTIGVITTGIIAFEIAYVTRRTRWWAAVATEAAITALPRRPVVLFTFWTATAVAIALVLAAMLHYGAGIFIGIRGGGLVFGPAASATMSQSEWLLVIYGLRVLLAVLLFIGVYLWKTRDRYDWPGRSMGALRWTVIVLGLLNLVVSNPLSAARLWAGSLVLTVMFIALRWKGARSYITWATLAILGLLVLFAGIDPRRIVTTSLRSGEPITVTNTLRIVGTSVEGIHADANFDAFEMVGLTQTYSDRMGYSFGKQLLLPALFWVPRSIWPGKPIGVGDIVGESLNLFSINVSAPMWAEGYANLGIVGVIVLLAVFGRIARVADDYLVMTTYRTGDVFPTVVSAFFAANMLILLRGDLTTGTMFLQMVVGFTYAIMFLIKRQSRRNTAPTA